MGDGAAERGLRGERGIDVDELTVLGGVGELVDALLGYLDPDGKAYSRKALILDFKDPSKPPRLQFPPPESGAPEGWSVRFGLDEKSDPQGRTAFEPDATRIVAYREKRSGLLQGDF